MCSRGETTHFQRVQSLGVKLPTEEEASKGNASDEGGEPADVELKHFPRLHYN